jgi:DNA-binding CsgD family transcriptional regulator
MLFISLSQCYLVANHRVHWQGLWGFTRAEADLAQHLAEGRTLSEAADASGVSINTVRTQLRGLLAKSGARRQSDLVRTLLLSRDCP